MDAMFRKGDIYTASKAEFERLKDAADVRQKLGEMKRSAHAYAKFLSPAEEGTRRCEAIAGHSGARFDVFYPLLVRLYADSSARY
ncbi:hypothetical protein ACH51_14495 [Ralstonia solanacearum]|nr:hypothetical protein ACH51_14495 [Ralstonia solanacearum]